ncbi:MAG: hypothetical protein A2Y53_04950 [Chloroflexi bacterium RBG_16_47_49]|nr:MAG: hypothetical protein A2Y53_04950 [Chloroflexi bacterium RBG_16_47_49]
MVAPYKEQLNRIEAALGFGDDSLAIRTARIEENLKTAAGLASDAKNAADRAAEKADLAVTRAADTVHLLALTVTRLEGTLGSHIGTDHLSVLMKKKSFWMLIVLGFISLHLISTYVPSIWDGIVLMLGIPKLLLPPIP